MSYTTNVDLNHAEIAALLLARAEQLGSRVHRFAQAYSPRESGRLAGSLYLRVRYRPGLIYAEVGTSLAYGMYQHEGTGIYAGRGLIHAKTRRYMKFRPGRFRGPLVKGAEHPARANRPFIYARTVKGVPPNPFLVQALTDVVGSVARIRRGASAARR